MSTYSIYMPYALIKRLAFVVVGVENRRGNGGGNSGEGIEEESKGAKAKGNGL